MTGLLSAIANAWSPVTREGRDNLPSIGSGRGMLSWMGGNRTEQLGAMAATSTVFGIVDRIASSQSDVEWKLYRKARSGNPDDRTEVTNHLAWDLWNQPNDVFSGPYVREAGQQHFELTGEARLIVELAEGFDNLPISYWVVRPDRIEPVPGDTTFLAGYVYTSVDGEKIPLRTNEVLTIMRPNPLDPYRGLGAIQATLLEQESARAAAEWNRNFFRNGAMPGGVIEVPNELSPDQFRNLILRWRESHKGVSRAHRIGVLEQGAKFTPITYSIKDMQMSEVRGMTRDTVMEAFGMSRHMLGITEDVNRSVAAAGEYMFAKYIDKPRATRWRAMANGFYLPLFGKTARDLALDFENLVPEDTEAENAARDSIATAVKSFVDAGFDREWICDYLGLPPIQLNNGSNLDFAERIALLAQKFYIAVGKVGSANVIFSPEEVRSIFAAVGVPIDPKYVDNTPDPAPPALPPAVPPQLPPVEPPGGTE